MCTTVFLNLFFKLSENFNSFHFSHIISYTSLHSSITKLSLTYYIRVSSIELYVHHITLSISGQCFVPHNQLIHCRCNIGTAAHLLFNKSPRSDFQECIDKVLYPFEFLQLHLIVILIWNELFGWLHTIWIWNSNTLLLSFYDFLLIYPSPIILLICLCHLCYPYFYFF